MARGGFPNMGGANMNNLMKQAQKLQQDMEKCREKWKRKNFQLQLEEEQLQLLLMGKTNSRYKN